MAAKTWSTRSGPPAAGAAGGGQPGAERGRALACRHDRGELAADGARRPEQREIGRAPMNLGGIAADHRDSGPGIHERPRAEGVLPEDRRADRKHDVVWRECLAQACPICRQVTGEERMILRKAGPAR